ncbi:hypothetical protein F4808DRAFT_237262 [Astrocystis sublimbata]|nr:hypothetical protein F4808DRAFT_237262 [Astrocystis sublimbata]
MSGDNQVYDNSQETPGVFNTKKPANGVLITFAIISWTCVVLRIHTRWRLQCLGWDDLFVVLFRISGTLGTIFLLLLYNYGFGLHFYEISPEWRMGFLKNFYVALLSYVLSTTLMKLCLLSQYLRLFTDDHRMRKIVWFAIVVCALWGTAFSVIALAPCVPLQGFWDWTLEDARCYGFGSRIPDEIGGTYAAHVGTNVILDLVVLAIPVPMFFQTLREKKQRLGFSIMILLGVGINIISILRLSTIIEHRAGTYPVVDPTFYTPIAIVLAALEVELASIVASVPVFWPMLTQSLGAIFVTHEVQVTHHHRRLSGEEHQFELHAPSTRSSRTRRGSDGSLKLVIMETEGTSRASSPTHGLDKSAQTYDKKDPYVRGRVYPLANDGMGTNETQVVSEGQRGFQKNYKEHFGGQDKVDDSRPSTTDRRSKDDQADRSWSLSLSRKPSMRF